MPFTGLLPDYWITLFNYIGISSLVAIGLVLLTGVGGMTSFGQAAFVGFGAYTTAVLTVQFGISPWLTLPASLVVTMVVAGLIGAITVRLSGHYLPLGTIAWGIAFFYLFGNIGWLGAHDGLAGIPPLRIGSYALTDPRDYFVVVWIAVVLAVIATQNLLGGRVGRAIRALRRSTRAAEAFGVNTAAAKLMVFVYAAMLAGLAGWLYAHFQRSVSPGPFGINTGTEYLLMAVLGGAGRVYGAILGAAGITFLRDQLQNFLPWLIGNTGNYETIAFGAVLVLILQTASNGVWPILFGPPPAADAAKAARRHGGCRTRQLPAPGTPLLQVQDGAQDIRRPRRRQRRQFRGPERPHHRTDRPQRRRQEHDLQPDHRRVSARAPAKSSSRATRCGRRRRNAPRRSDWAAPSSMSKSSPT